MKGVAESWMRRALALARKGEGRVSPNPMVGAVLVRGGKMLADGYHRAFGGAHAEIEALAKAGNKARGADLYLNLEPCCHHGKTPPCAERLVAAGVKRVIIANRDPNPLVNGGGIRRLKKAGIEVVEGVLAEAGAELNRAFFTWVTRGRPYVSLKIAASLDGKIALADGRSRWISGERARQFVHRLRRQCDAVLVGVGTVLADDPQLTARLGRDRAPWRVILDSRLRTPAQARVLQESDRFRTLLFCSDAVPEAVQQRFRANDEVGLVALPPAPEGVDLAAALHYLAQAGVARLLVEGGARVGSSFLRQGLVDELLLLCSPKLIGAGGLSWLGGHDPTALSRPPAFALRSATRLGEDLLAVYRRAREG